MEVPVLEAGLVERLEQAIDTLGRPAQEISAAGDALAERLERAADAFARPAQDAASAGGAIAEALRSAHRSRAGTAAPAPAAPASTPRAPKPARRAAAATAVDRLEEVAIPPARQRLLDALASLESIGVAQVAKTQLALWAGVSPRSSGYQNNLGGLRSAGLIDYPASFAALTDAGRSRADRSLAAQALTTNELHEHVRQLLPPARWRIVEPLIASYPEPMAKADLPAAAGVSPASSGYQNNLGGLRTLGLIDYPQPGLVVAAPLLFMEGR